MRTDGNVCVPPFLSSISLFISFQPLLHIFLSFVLKGLSMIPEGTRFRLPFNFNVSTIPNAFARVIATALRDYGMITADTSGGVVLYGTSSPLPFPPYLPPFLLMLTQLRTLHSTARTPGPPSGAISTPATFSNTSPGTSCKYVSHLSF